MVVRMMAARPVRATMEITEAVTAAATATAKEAGATEIAEVMVAVTAMRNTTGMVGTATVTMAASVIRGTTRCNYLQCRSDSAASFQHPRRDRGFSLSSTPPFGPYDR